MYSGRRCESTDLQPDHFGSGCDLDLKHEFPKKLRLLYNSFDASRKEEHDAGKMNVTASLSQNLLPNCNLRKNGYLKVCAL